MLTVDSYTGTGLRELTARIAKQLRKISSKPPSSVINCLLAPPAFWSAPLTAPHPVGA